MCDAWTWTTVNCRSSKVTDCSKGKFLWLAVSATQREAYFRVKYVLIHTLLLYFVLTFSVLTHM